MEGGKNNLFKMDLHKCEREGRRGIRIEYRKPKPELSMPMKKLTLPELSESGSRGAREFSCLAKKGMDISEFGPDLVELSMSPDMRYLRTAVYLRQALASLPLSCSGMVDTFTMLRHYMNMRHEDINTAAAGVMRKFLAACAVRIGRIGRRLANGREPGAADRDFVRDYLECIEKTHPSGHLCPVDTPREANPAFWPAHAWIAMGGNGGQVVVGMAQEKRASVRFPHGHYLYVKSVAEQIGQP
jgi:hypothetical protein